MKVLGEDHKDTLGLLMNLGVIYHVGLKNCEKAFEYYERALKGFEKMLEKTHPTTLTTVTNVACFCTSALQDFEKAESYFERALEGREAQLGKDHDDTKKSAKGLAMCLKSVENPERLERLKRSYQ